MDLTLIGPNRREATSLGRLAVTIADVVGVAVGAALAIVVILLLSGVL